MKESIKSVVRRFGFDIQRLSVEANPNYRLLRALDRFGVDLVFDVGANTGQFARELRSVGFRGRIVSFEPLPDAHQLLSAAAARDPKWTVHSRSALGDVDGEIEMNVAGNSASSSVLPMLAAHAEAAAESRYVGKTMAPIRRLDSISGEYLTPACRSLVKIDTQGYEWQVMDGATNTLSSAVGVFCELSLVPLYDGQRLWLDMLNRLEADGFELWSLQTGFTDPRDGRTLQIDAAFFRVRPSSQDSRARTSATNLSARALESAQRR